MENNEKKIYDHIKTVRDDDSFDPNEETDLGYTLLQLSCMFGYTQCVRMLLEVDKIDINKATEFGETAFYFACNFNNNECIRLLLEEPQLDPNKTDNNGISPFYSACHRQLMASINFFAKQTTRMVNYLTSTNKNSISISDLLTNYTETTTKITSMISENNNRPDTIKILLEDQRIDVNKPDMNGRTPFNLVCRHKLLDIVKIMIGDSRIDINKEDNTGCAPIHSVCIFDNGFVGSFIDTETQIGIIKLLLDDQRLIGYTQNKTPLDVAITFGDDNLPVIKMLLSDDRITISNYDYLFYYACSKGFKKIVKLFLTDGRFDPNTRSSSGHIYLEIACHNKHSEIVELLLKDPRTIRVHLSSFFIHDEKVIGVLKKYYPNFGNEFNADFDGDE